MGERKRISREGLPDAAVAVPTLSEAIERALEFVQLYLQPREGLELSVAEAFELANARTWALHAADYLHGKKAAKALEIGVADGRPLAICGVPVMLSIGFQKSTPIETEYGEVRLPNSGCFRVFPDSLRQDRGRMWAYWCQKCKPRANKATRYQGKRRAERLEQARARSGSGQISMMSLLS